MSWLAQHFVVDEPRLVFNLTEKAYCSFNPMEGLRRWGPLDASIPGYLRPNPLRLATITGESSVGRILNHLHRLTQVVPLRSRSDYLQGYPGFRAIFQSNLEFPRQTSGSLLLTVSNSEMDRLKRLEQPELRYLNLLKDRIRLLITERHRFDVLVIHIPNEALAYRRRPEEYGFDLHDSLKAFCAASGIRLQVVEDDSIDYPEPGRVSWWLALALYVKGNGIPWRLAEPAPGTVYVGLAYSTGGVRRRDPFVLGCGQLFDEQGEWIRFLLYPFEPIWRGRNPFMTRDQARKLFTQIREKYQSYAQGRPPRRVVVHKTVYFSDDEMRGIAEALDGVENYELVTLQQDTAYRAIMMYNQASGSFFPVLRGTCIPLDNRSALLWTSGDVLGVAPNNRHYYQEQRNIPRPLLITRYRGKDDLETVASDILKMTKMNWNNLQLYSFFPATLSFASAMARVAQQLESTSDIPFDFRYFM